jgi:predicted nucleic acid-binding protein
MRYLLDTNVLSELAKPAPEPQVVAWFSEKSSDCLFISAITVGEISYGIERMARGKRKEGLRTWFFSVLVEWFSDRIFAIDEKTMLAWARIRVEGRTLPILDSLIAATAIATNSTLVTRNTKDFEGVSNLNIINPWANL